MAEIPSRWKLIRKIDLLFTMKLNICELHFTYIGSSQNVRNIPYMRDTKMIPGKYITFPFLIIFYFVSSGCVPPSGTSDFWIREGKDLTQYKTIEVLPVADSTGIFNTPTIRHFSDT